MSCRVFRAMTWTTFISSRLLHSTGRLATSPPFSQRICQFVSQLISTQSERGQSLSHCHSETQSAHSGELTERGPIISSLSSATFELLGVRPRQLSVRVTVSGLPAFVSAYARLGWCCCIRHHIIVLAVFRDSGHCQPVSMV